MIATREMFPVSKRLQWTDLKIGDWVQIGDVKSLLPVTGFRDSGIDGMRPEAHGFTFDPSEVTKVSRAI